MQQILGGDAAERVVDRVLRAHRGWSREQRTAVVEALFNMALWRRRLAFLLDDPAPSAPRMLFALLAGLARMNAEDARRVSGLREALRLREEPPRTLAELASLPDWLAAHFEEELGPEAPDFALHLNVPGPVTLRANALRITRAALAERLRGEGIETTGGLLSPHALRVVGRANLYGCLALREGFFDVQDEGSQLLGLLVDAQPGETVLDYCAGAGGKTLQLGAQMGDQGALHAHDPDAARLDRLLQRTARAGLTRVRVHRTPPPASLQADRVLVDAPCSELGTLRRGPDVRFRLPASVLETFPPLQLQILREAAAHVKPGGALVYATCTVNRRENQDLVSAFLEAHSGFTLEPAVSAGIPASCVDGPFLSTAPHRQDTDAFFAARLRRA